MAVRYSRLGAGLPVALAISVGCGRAPAPAVRPDAAASAVPVDRLRPGELASGGQEAFGLLLPRGMRVTQRFAKSAYAEGDLDAGEVANFFRERVTAGRIELAGTKTVFSQVRLPGQNRDYQIDVFGGRRPCRVVVRDVTPEPAGSAGLSEEERWKRAGMSPEGGLLDPDALK
jgi:hypothetical protein